MGFKLKRRAQPQAARPRRARDPFMAMIEGLSRWPREREAWQGGDDSGQVGCMPHGVLSALTPLSLLLA